MNYIEKFEKYMTQNSVLKQKFCDSYVKIGLIENDIKLAPIKIRHKLRKAFYEECKTIREIDAEIENLELCINLVSLYKKKLIQFKEEDFKQLKLIDKQEIYALLKTLFFDYSFSGEERIIHLTYTETIQCFHKQIKNLLFKFEVTSKDPYSNSQDFINHIWDIKVEIIDNSTNCSITNNLDKIICLLEYYLNN